MCVADAVYATRAVAIKLGVYLNGPAGEGGSRIIMCFNKTSL